MKHLENIDEQLDNIFDGENENGAVIILGEKFNPERFEMQSYCDGSSDFLFIMIAEVLSHMFVDNSDSTEKVDDYVEYFFDLLEIACKKAWKESHAPKYLQ